MKRTFCLLWKQRLYLEVLISKLFKIFFFMNTVEKPTKTTSKFSSYSWLQNTFKLGKREMF